MWNHIRQRLDIWVVAVTCLLLYFLYFMVVSLYLPPNMKRGPLLVFISGVFLTIFEVVRTIIQVRKRKIELWTEERIVSPDFFVFLAWILGFYIAIYVFGFQIAFLLFIGFYLKVEAKAGWMNMFILFFVGLGTLYYFGEILRIQWPEGILRPLYDTWLPENSLTRFLGL